MGDLEARDGPTRQATATIERTNRQLNLGEATAIGLSEGLGGFAPVLIARLGGSPFDVGLLTSITGLVGLVFATQAAAIMRRRTDVVRTYAWLRLVGYLRFAVVAVVVVVLPPPVAIPVIIAVWAIASVPSTMFNVAVPVLIEGIAGTRGRVDLLATRWGLMNVGTIVSSAGAGVVLTALGLHVGYALVMTGATVLAVVAFGFGRRYRIATAPHAADPTPAHPWRAARAAFAHAGFRRHVLARALLVGSASATPILVTLLLVREMALEDQQIGLLLAAQQAGAIGG